MKETDLYLKIPSSTCKKGCFDCCTFIIQSTPDELKAMGGYEYKDGKCVHLVDGKCTVYQSRPLVCRIYGTSEIMRCDGCTPERYLSEQETRDIMHTYVEIKKKQEAEK